MPGNLYELCKEKGSIASKPRKLPISGGNSSTHKSDLMNAHFRSRNPKESYKHKRSVHLMECIESLLYSQILYTRSQRTWRSVFRSKI